MIACNQCAGPLGTATADIDLAATPMLSGLVLACTDCGRPIQLLHTRPRSGRRSRSGDRAELNRVLRAARRMQARRP